MTNKYAARRAAAAKKLREQRAERKAAGLCTRCGTEPPRPGRVDCRYCAAQNRGYRSRIIVGKPKPSAEETEHGNGARRTARPD